MVNYHFQVTGDLEKVRDAADLWTQTHPRDARPVGFLSAVYQQLGQSQKSVDEGIRAVAIDPSFVFGYNNLGWVYVQTAQPDQAEKTLQQASAHKLYMSEFASIRFALAFYGHLRQPRIRAKHAVDLNQNPSQFERAAAYKAGSAVREPFFGNRSEAGKYAAEARKLSNSRESEYGAALAMLIAGEAGDMTEAQRIATGLSERFKEDTPVKFLYLPTIRALILLPRDPQKHGTAASFCTLLPIGAVVHLSLAKALLISGDPARAEAAYQDFLSL